MSISSPNMSTTNDDGPQADVWTASPSSSHPKSVTLGTRVSLLARVQTDLVAKTLQKAHPGIHCEIVGMKTMGDKDKNTPLHAFNAKALWTTELEEQLAKGELDMVVHSLKDMPTQLPSDMCIGAILERDEPRDALIVHPSLSSTLKSLSSLPAGSVIGTSSLRRSAQMKRLHPHLKFADCRGNIDTRLAKLDDPDSGIAAIILAAAGLHRIGMQDRITSYLSSDNNGLLYAVGQGAIGVEIRTADEATKALLKGVGDEWTTRQCLAERSLMRTLEGGCSVPIGVEGRWVPKSQTLTSTVDSDAVGIGSKMSAQYDKVSGAAISTSNTEHAEQEHRSEELFMKAIVVSLDGQQAVEAELSCRVSSRQDADQFGFDLARKLVDGGADKILEQITLNRKIIEGQNNA